MQTDERRLISRCLGACVELCSPRHCTQKALREAEFQCAADQKLVDRGRAAQVIEERLGNERDGGMRAHGVCSW